MKNRKQYVIINNVNSSLETIQTGVPQGSILGPLLFIIYINDIVHSSKKLKFLCFADDTTVTFSICLKNKNCKDCHNENKVNLRDINAELDKLYTWFLVNRLSLNLGKTK